VGDIQRLGRSPSLRTAALTSAALSALFVVVYGGTNWITSLRNDVGTWVYDWEFLIPFVPIMIIPYMSIDLFFVAGPFLCTDRHELRVLTRRIVFAILVAATCFLIYPLRCMYVKPPLEGWLGWIFGTFLTFDKPYNLLPSLHIALRSILADLYARHTSGAVRWASNIWFSLIGISTILTYQHHVVDVIGGFVLAAISFYVFPDAPERTAPARNRRVASYYAIGTAVTLALAFATWPTGGLLLWPATSLGIMTAAYCGFGARVYRKTAGRLPLSTRFIMGPVLLGQWLSLLYYRRQCRAWDEVCPGLFIGRVLDAREAKLAIKHGVKAVLDLTAEFAETAAFRALRYRNIPILDLTAPTQEQLHEAVEFIAGESAQGAVYVHCKIGYSRSAAVVGAYLLASGQAATVDAAIECLRRVRPTIVIRPEAELALREFAVNCDKTKKPPTDCHRFAIDTLRS
jgi:protein-tyrosine phosphatase